LSEELPEEELLPPATEHHYTAFDPTTIDPEPAPVEEPDGETEGATEDDSLPDFDPRYRNEFDGLLFIGALNSKFRWFHHDFEIRTLRTDELLRVALAIKPYQDSMGDAKAYQAAVVAACVVSVDGQPLPLPIDSTDPDTVFRYRFDWVTRKWFPAILDVVYEEYLSLETKVAVVLAEAGN
jgi:hypothetical protein